MYLNSVINLSHKKLNYQVNIKRYFMSVVLWVNKNYTIHKIM